MVQQWLKKNKTAVDESVEIKWAETTARRVIPVEQGWWNKSFAALDSWTGGLLGIGGKGSYKIVEAAAGEAEVLVARIGSLGDPEMYLRIGVEKKVDYVIVERQKEFLSNEKEFLIFDVNGMTGDARHLTLGQLAGKAQAFAGSHGMQVDSLEEAQQIVQLHSGINFKNRIPAFSETAITKGLKATRTSALVIEAIEQTGDALKDSGKDLWKKLWPSTSQESSKTDFIRDIPSNTQKVPGIEFKGNRISKTIRDLGRESEAFAAIKAAKQWQGKGSYPGIDDWGALLLRKRDLVLGGAPGQSEFYVSQNIVKKGADANAIFNAIQVKPDPIRGYRPGLTVYEVQQDVVAAYSIAKANPKWGNGGALQLYVEDYPNVLKPLKSIILFNRAPNK